LAIDLQIDNERYYNGTTTITFNPYAGLSQNQVINRSIIYCNNLAGSHSLGKLDTTLAITESGERVGSLARNPIDFYLNIWSLASDEAGLSNIALMPGVPSRRWLVKSSRYVSKTMKRLSGAHQTQYICG
jgi:hypothetical protein